MKWLVAAGCGYEIAAITTGRVPTITDLCDKSPLLGAGILAVLAIHLFRSAIHDVEAES